MSTPGRDREGKLSKLGQQLERSLTTMLKDLEGEVEQEEPGKNGAAAVKVKRAKYSLLDKLRVYDRALKLEAIRHKISDDEGGFFGANKGGSDEQ